MSHIHFRQEHFLCEDKVCLAKQFIVFAIESELKVISISLNDASFPFGHQYLEFVFYVFWRYYVTKKTCVFLISVEP
jgi:hypothetical protein